jgi:hypothetical protein
VTDFSIKILKIEHGYRPLTDACDCLSERSVEFFAATCNDRIVYGAPGRS